MVDKASLRTRVRLPKPSFRSSAFSHTGTPHHFFTPVQSLITRATLRNNTAAATITAGRGPTAHARVGHAF